jgi:hypothetical protein
VLLCLKMPIGVGARISCAPEEQTLLSQ